jgi:hypothetical protein
MQVSQLETNHKSWETFPRWQILHGAKETNFLTRPLTVSGINPHKGEKIMSTVLMIILVLLLVGALPTWPYSSGWGYYPASGLGLVLLITLVVLLFSGRTV